MARRATPGSGRPARSHGQGAPIASVAGSQRVAETAAIRGRVGAPGRLAGRPGWAGDREVWPAPESRAGRLVGEHQVGPGLDGLYAATRLFRGTARNAVVELIRAGAVREAADGHHGREPGTGSICFEQQHGEAEKVPRWLVPSCSSNPVPGWSAWGVSITPALLDQAGRSWGCRAPVRAAAGRADGLPGEGFSRGAGISGRPRRGRCRRWRGGGALALCQVSRTAAHRRRPGGPGPGGLEPQAGGPRPVITAKPSGLGRGTVLAGPFRLMIPPGPLHLKTKLKTSGSGCTPDYSELMISGFSSEPEGGKRKKEGPWTSNVRAEKGRRALRLPAATGRADPGRAEARRHLRGGQRRRRA